MSQENAMLAIVLLVSFGFLLGRLSLTLKNNRLEKENQVMKNLLYRLSAMERLNSQTLTQIIQEFIRTQKPTDLRPRVK